MHLIALVESPNHVCCRYRLTAFQSFLETHGHSLEFRCFPRSFAERWKIGSDLGHADAVIVQRKLLASWQVFLLRRRVRRLIFDLDDAVWLRDSYAKRGFASARRLQRFRSVVKASDAVIAGNAFLAEHARTWTQAPVEIIPTCVDESRYPVAHHESTKAVQLVWVGSSSTLQGLEMTRPLLDAIGSNVPGIRLKVICDRFPTFASMPVDPCPWDGSTEAADIASAAIGISWVPDDPWSRGKCGLKVLQYMAAGLPVVANPVGVHVEMIRPGETGFLATTTEEWIAAIRALASNPNLRRDMGRAGREMVERDYSVRAGAERWLTLIRSWNERRESA